jgi:hypothetical protein
MKKCSKCNIEKDETEFHKGRICKKCTNEQSLKRYYANLEKVKAQHAAYRKKNKKKIRKQAAAYRKRTNDAVYKNKKRSEYKDGLANCYVVSRITKQGRNLVKNVTPEMIEEKKTEILIERLKKRIESTGIKICSICKETKPIGEFGKRQWTWKGEKKYGSDNVCKKCRDARCKQKYRKNREKVYEPPRSIVANKGDENNG